MKSLEYTYKHTISKSSNILGVLGFWGLCVFDSALVHSSWAVVARISVFLSHFSHCSLIHSLIHSDICLTPESTNQRTKQKTIGCAAVGAVDPGAAPDVRGLCAADGATGRAARPDRVPSHERERLHQRRQRRHRGRDRLPEGGAQEAVLPHHHAAHHRHRRPPPITNHNLRSQIIC